MKKLIYILIGIVTFSIGFWLFQFNVEIAETKVVSLCEVAENPNYYEFKQIKVRAFLAVGGYYDVISGIKATDYKSDCASKIVINISDELKRNKDFSKISNELEQNRRESQKGLRDGWSITEVEFTGELIETGKSGISAKNYFVLTPIEVKQISTIKFITPKDVSTLNKDLSLD